MNEFILLLRREHRSLVKMSPEEMQARLEKYWDWLERLRKTGQLKAARPLANTGSVLKGRSGVLVKDGPFVESKEAIAGYLIIAAETLSEAVEIARGCPALDADGSVEVRPLLEVGGDRSL